MKLTRLTATLGPIALLWTALSGATHSFAAGAVTAAQPSTGLDPASAKALEQTQALLKNRALREQAIKADPNSRAADIQAHALEGSGVSGEAIYGLSSEIFEDLVKQADGDPIKMQEILQQAQKDPKGFAERMSEKNKKAIRDLSGKAMVAPDAAPK
jgi:hypothetical protein